MCGIAGWIDWEEGRWEYREGVVREMTRTLANRGPDAEGFFVSGSAALGHRRLIVVDPEGAASPWIAPGGGSGPYWSTMANCTIPRTYGPN